MGNALANFYDHISNVNRNMMESALSFNEIGARAQAVLARQHFEVAEICLEAGAKQVQAAVSAASPQDLISRQGEVLAELSERLVDMAQDVLDIHNQARVEFGLCVEDTLDAASIKLSSTSVGTELTLISIQAAQPCTLDKRVESGGA